MLNTPLNSNQQLALVTGGSRGIGAAIAEVLHSKGICVLVPGRSELDLSSPVSVNQFVDHHKDLQVDILVNNAGINELAAIPEWTPELWQRMIQVNLLAPATLIQFVAKSMRAKQWGRIVNLSSVFSQVTKEKRAAYSATKSGLNGLTRTVAVELAPYNILVNAVAPGYIETELTFKNNSPSDLDGIIKTIPMGRMGKPEEVARFVAYLCSSENTYLTGQTLALDGGFLCK